MITDSSTCTCGAQWRGAGTATVNWTVYIRTEQRGERTKECNADGETAGNASDATDLRRRRGRVTVACGAGASADTRESRDTRDCAAPGWNAKLVLANAAASGRPLPSPAPPGDASDMACMAAANFIAAAGPSSDAVRLRRRNSVAAATAPRMRPVMRWRTVTHFTAIAASPRALSL